MKKNITLLSLCVLGSLVSCSNNGGSFDNPGGTYTLNYTEKDKLTEEEGQALEKTIEDKYDSEDFVAPTSGQVVGSCLNLNEELSLTIKENDESKNIKSIFKSFSYFGGFNESYIYIGTNFTGTIVQDNETFNYEYDMVMFYQKTDTEATTGTVQKLIINDETKTDEKKYSTSEINKDNSDYINKMFTYDYFTYITIGSLNYFSGESTYYSKGEGNLYEEVKKYDTDDNKTLIATAAEEYKDYLINYTYEESNGCEYYVLGNKPVESYYVKIQKFFKYNSGIDSSKIPTIDNTWTKDSSM